MICGCCKDLGCFVYDALINFDIVSSTDNSPYVFHIWSNGNYSTKQDIFIPGVPVQLPFTFNENSETTIKIEMPSDSQTNNSYFVTTPDGACCFTVHGMISNCQ
tara:strand:+ start:118 stop:429 length:312 start_codon:yes stop_codon:yes gene_type:complete